MLAPLGADVAVRLHRRLADALAALIVAHVAVVMLADPARLGLLGFFGAPWRAQAAIGSVIAIGILMVSSMRRRGVRLSYAGWRGIHVVLGAGALVLAVIHTVGVGRYLARGAPEVALVVLTVVGLGAVLVLRLPRVGGSRLRPYLVRRVVQDPAGATTLELEADGHAGQPFSPGQFAWLKLPGIRSSLAEHPFSYSSSALEPERPAFTIQPYEGFSREVSRFAEGTRVLVDGPHGSFRLQPGAPGCVLVAGGIGITPSMSVLWTADAQADPRRFLLLYAAKTPDRFVFRRELDALRSHLRLDVVLVASAPPASWTGERGRITSELLDRVLPSDLREWQFLVCGPPAFVDAALRSLGGVGIPVERVHAERFVTV
jgi:predicted ferric reductase